MLVIVCYDVNTETSAGRRRLRRVAKVRDPDLGVSQMRQGWRKTRYRSMGREALRQ
jgi:hypothetical protein